MQLAAGIADLYLSRDIAELRAHGVTFVTLGRIAILTPSARAMHVYRRTNVQPASCSGKNISSTFISPTMSDTYFAEKQVAIAAVRRACALTSSVFNKLVRNETLTKDDKSPVTGEPDLQSCVPLSSSPYDGSPW